MDMLVIDLENISFLIGISCPFPDSLSNLLTHEMVTDVCDPWISQVKSSTSTRCFLQTIFIEAAQNGTMEVFYELISYFQMQSEPTYCGLASLSMVLNALAVDPGRTWKGPWRWFDESMLDCCEPLEKAKAKGISFGKLACLAHCAGPNVQAFRTNESSIYEFWNYVKARSKLDDCHVFSSYHRGIFKQIH